MNSKSEQLIKLDNTNYYSWKYKMEMLLTKEDVWETVMINDELIPTGVRALTIWRKNDRKAKALIGLSVNDDQLVYIRNCTTAKESWLALKQAHEKNTMVNKVLLHKKLAKKQLKEGGDIQVHINDMNDIFQQLGDIEGATPDEWKIGILLASLPKSYDAIVTALEVKSKLTWSNTQSMLIDHYMKMNEEIEEEPSTSAMYSGNSKYKLECFFCKERHKLSECETFKIYKKFDEFQKKEKLNDKYKKSFIANVDDSNGDEIDSTCEEEFDSKTLM